MNMYYSMNTLEIVTLLFVLFLWALSIYWLFKRYRKLTTIERADLGYRGMLDAKKDSIVNQNSSLDEVAVENDANNCEKSDSSSFLRGDEEGNEGEIEVDEVNSSSNSITKLEYLKEPTTRVSNINELHAFNKTNNTQLLNLAKFNNFQNYSAISSNGTSAATSFTNLRDSIFMFNNMKDSIFMLKNTYPERDSNEYSDDGGAIKEKKGYEEKNELNPNNQSKSIHCASIRVFKSNSLSSNSNKRSESPENTVKNFLHSKYKPNASSTDQQRNNQLKPKLPDYKTCLERAMLSNQRECLSIFNSTTLNSISSYSGTNKQSMLSNQPSLNLTNLNKTKYNSEPSLNKNKIFKFDPIKKSFKIYYLDKTNLNNKISSVSEHNFTKFTRSTNLNYLNKQNNLNQLHPHRQKHEKKSRSKHHHRRGKSKDTELLDPKLIPQIIKKNLLDLHKKSQWNLSHSNFLQKNSTSSINASSSNVVSPKSYLTIKQPNTLAIHSKPSHKMTIQSKLNSLGNEQPSSHIVTSHSQPFHNNSVVTQHKNKNEIPMKITENYV